MVRSFFCHLVKYKKGDDARTVSNIKYLNYSNYFATIKK